MTGLGNMGGMNLVEVFGGAIVMDGNTKITLNLFRPCILQQNFHIFFLIRLVFVKAQKRFGIGFSVLTLAVG